MAMAWGQGELFAQASEKEIQRTKFLLSKYVYMKSLMSDFENFERDLKQVAIDGEAARRIDHEDLHADKTANAAILIEKRRWVYQQYNFYTRQLYRAWALIHDTEAREAIEYRYIKGHSFKETILFFRYGISESAVRRKIVEGIKTIANTLNLIGFFEQAYEDF
ncbi:hypothetical protein AWM70_00080 [Paenibacillus yonginensis]|uniref:Uncharacterized protein n=1 Tax=Paenibacillus yonginensis TaxID=1462996 RepID=A0A1B1MVL1_9BACL|nr:hypothetical protein [Paenibacillus yonginensis]ANS73177.1 hypothetical protein AWM70_00080 [Paenibacillus yonginensis]